MAQVKIEIDEVTLKELVSDYLRDRIGDLEIRPEDFKIETKSAQNNRSEWESAHFRAVLNKQI